MIKPQKKAIILFSGGLDSTTCLALAKSQGYLCHVLTFDYGQKHVVEVERAKMLAKTYEVIQHKILRLPLDEIGGSSLTDDYLHVPDFEPEREETANTYVPARNTILLSFALSWGEVIGAYDIFYGANHIDYSNYCDCRPDFIEAFENLATFATDAGVKGKKFKIHTPLLYLSKAEIIKTGLTLGVSYENTISCYRANEKGEACGTCDSCTFRIKGFKEASVIDPTPYY